MPRERAARRSPTPYRALRRATSWWPGPRPGVHSRGLSDSDQLWTSVPRWWLYSGVLVLTAFVFGPTLAFEFVYDDHWTLLGNGFLRTPADVGLLFTPQAGARHVPDAFRPTLVLFDLVSYQVLGLSKLGHHAVSVVLHTAVTALVGLWMAGEGAPRRLVVAAMTLFGVLAIHSEAVAVVSYREDLLAAGLGLGALLLATSAIRGSKAPLTRCVAAGGLMTIACGAKLSAAGLPAAWVLLQRLGPWRDPEPWRRVSGPALALLLGVVAFVGFRASVLGGIDPYGPSSRVFAEQVGWGPVLAASAQIHLTYLQQLFIPRGFSPEYVDYGARWRDPATLCALGAGLGLLAVAWRAARGRRAPVVAWVVLAAIALALPTSNLAPMPNMRADRFMYLPSVPVCVGMAAVLLHLGDRWARRTSISPLVPWILMVVVQGSVAQGVAAAYRSDTRLWEIALRRAPGSARAHAIYGELLVAQLRRRPDPRDEPLMLVRARTHCALARAWDPLSDLSHLCEARLAATERAWARSHHAFQSALSHAGVRRDRAMVALASTALDLEDVPYPQRVERAFEWLAQARAEYPYVAEVFAVSGRIRHRLGDAAGAADDYRRASALHPERWDLVLAGLELQLDLGHASAAAQTWEQSQAALAEAPEARLRSFQRRLDTARRLTSTPR